jgi:beta-galactosidase beta subunit
MCDTQLVPGRFAIYYPTDGHMPQIESSLMSNVKKVVIKINTALIV